MPTKRTFALVGLAIGLYLLANQTQVGWVYIMSNILMGLVFAAYLYSLGGLKSIQARRSFHAVDSSTSSNQQADLPHTPEFFEDDPIQVELQLEQSAWKPAFLLAGQLPCPFAPPDEQQVPFFVSSLFRRRPVALTCQTSCHRRGRYQLDDLSLRSSGPFGLFWRQRTLPTPAELLVYPAYQPIKRLRLLESRGFADRRATRSGHSTEIIGTREYRPGDALRHIHWRSTARVGSLIVKEVADDDQLTINVVLDLSTGGNLGRGKFSTFETAVRLAASLGFFATRNNLPFRLIGSSPSHRPPALDLSWWGVLNYLATVQNNGTEPLERVLTTLQTVPFAVVLASHPTQTVCKAIANLPRRGIQTLAILITPDGTPPVAAPAANQQLVVHTVSPHTWAETLAGM